MKIIKYQHYFFKLFFINTISSEQVYHFYHVYNHTYYTCVSRCFSINFIVLFTGYFLSIYLSMRVGWKVYMMTPYLLLRIQWDPGPVSWGCRIHRPHICRGARHPQQVSRIWHETIWWWGSSIVRVSGNAKYPFIAIAPRSPLARSGNTW